jgi:hypothetical protein
MSVLLSTKAAKMNTLAVESSLDSMTLGFVEGWTKGMLSSESLPILSSIDVALLSMPGSI